MTCSANCGGGGPGGGGGGGSSPGFWIKAYTATSEQFEQGYSKELGKGERIKFLINNTEHYVGVVLLTSTQATINISSKPQQAVFSVGDEKRFDVSGDGNYDLSVKLNSIANNKAEVLIKSYSEIINVNPNPEDNHTANSSLIDNNNLNNNNFSGSSWRIYIVIFLVALIIIILAVIFYLVYRQRKNQAINNLKIKLSEQADRDY
jgi:cbb3-type cytochrome oxidase subunit 3